MPVIQSPNPDEPVSIDLRNPGLAALLAWLWPGAGHLYQRRYAKGSMVMVCILGLYFFGLALGGGHVVYASFTKEDRRYHYLCQVGVGIPALPALLQRQRVLGGNEPLFGGIMAPPRQPVLAMEHDQLAEWHREYHIFFELGTLYTMVAGLLNILVVYDAYAGPFFPAPARGNDKPPPGKRRDTPPPAEAAEAEGENT